MTTVMLPIFILPIGSSFLIDSKTLFFFVIGLAIFAIWTFNSFLKKTIQFTFSPFLFPVLLLLLATVISGFLNGIYPMNQFVGLSGGYIAFCLVILLAPSLIPEKFGKYFLFALIVPAVFLALASVGELTHMGASTALNAAFNLGIPNSPVFSLAGGPLFTLQILMIALAGTLMLILTNKSVPVRFFAFIAALLMITGVIVNGQTMIKENLLSTSTLPYAASWSIAADSLKSVKATVIGVGPHNYQEVSTNYRPAWVNTTPVWNLQFDQGSNSPLTLIATHGLLGLIAWLWLAVAVIQQTRKATSKTYPFAAMAIFTLILQLLLPPNIILIGVQALLFVFWIVIEKDILQDVQIHAFTVQLIKSGSDVQKVPKQSHFLVYVIVALSAVAIAASGFWFGRYALSQYYVFAANLANFRNNGLGSYNNQVSAIAAYPYADEYHRALANSALSIATQLAQNNKEPNEQLKQQINDLLQQAVQESRTTITIDQNNSLNWLTIARIYSNLVGAIQGTDQPSLQAYSQAIALAPTEPNANFELGALLFRLEKYALAVQQLEKTVQLKPDWPNAWYNLANAYAKDKQIQKSYDAYAQTLKLLPAGEEFDKIKLEQDEVKKELDVLNAQAQAAAEKAAAEQAKMQGGQQGGAVQGATSEAPPQQQAPVATVAPTAPPTTVPAATPTATPTVSPSATATPTPTTTPSPTPSPSESPSPSP